MSRALIIVDVQADFCEGGALPVTGGNAVAEAIRSYVTGPAGARYSYVLASMDWHVDPEGHFSGDPDFRSTWPPHCLAGTPGAEIHRALHGTRRDQVFVKGKFAAAYSAFEGLTHSGITLGTWLRGHEVTEVDVCGLATDYCVFATARDAHAKGLVTRLLTGLSAGVAPETTAQAISVLRTAGVTIDRGEIPQR